MKNPCYEKSFASHPKSQYWHPTKNGDVKPRDVFKSSGKKYWFKCDKEDCGHDFETRLSDVTNKNNWCSYCSNKKLCKDNCKLCYKKSFASHPKAQYWHPTKNGDVKPRDVFKSSHSKYWFKCSDCGHDFESALNNVTNHNRWCPYCANKKLCKDENCVPCYKKSFASHPKAQYLHPTKNKNVNPRDIFKSSDMKCWFICDKEDCGHDFETRLCDVTNHNRWCPYCVNQKICKHETCVPCYKKSFASHSKAQDWHPTKNKNVNPRDVFKSTNKKYWFKCSDCGHDFESALNNVTCSNRWCPYCVNKTERKFYNFLLEIKANLKIKEIKKCYRPKWANLNKTHGTFYEYDFYIVLTNNVKIIIEIDGPQHYKQISNWGSVLKNQIRDRIKEQIATNQEINMIRLNQEDVLHNKNRWELDTLNFIKKKFKSNNEIEIYDCADGDRYY